MAKTSSLANLKESRRELKSNLKNNIKNPLVFLPDYQPEEMLIRPEAEKIADNLAEYEKLGIARHLIVYGSRGAGKTITVSALVKEYAKDSPRNLNYVYINARNNQTTYKLYSAIEGVYTKGLTLEEMRKKAEKKLTDHTVLIIDEADYLKDIEALYYISRYTRSEIFLITQKVNFTRMLDESVRSSLMPYQIVFHDYNAEEMTEILTMRASEGLKEYNKGMISLLSAKTVHDYRSDTRIGITALKVLGNKTDWVEEDIENALQTASQEVERETIQSLPMREIAILGMLSKIAETNKAYIELQKNSLFKMSNPTFFTAVNHLQNLGLITLIKQRTGKSFTYEAQIEVKDRDIITEELERRL